MTTEEHFTEKWKELESSTRLAFSTWDGRDMENFWNITFNMKTTSWTRGMKNTYCVNRLAEKKKKKNNFLQVQKPQRKSALEEEVGLWRFLQRLVA